MNKTYQEVGGLKPGRSVFNLSYDKKFDGDMGYIYPVLCEECVPGDTWKVKNNLVIRFNPLVAPIQHEIYARVHYFFVPTRLLMTSKEVPVGSDVEVSELWNTFLTGGVDGTDDTIALPRWIPETSAGYDVGSLWDYFGYPTGVKPDDEHCPLSFGKRALNFIWNEYYRDQNLQEKRDLDDDSMMRVAWGKDYFTSALPWQQRGIAPALPVTVNAPEISGNGFLQYFDSSQPYVKTGLDNSIGVQGYSKQTGTDHTSLNMAVEIAGGEHDLNALYVSGSQFKASAPNAVTFNISDLRLATQIQKFYERNARTGARYTEFLKAHFGVSPTDARLDRPEYLGGSKSPVIISEVLQTSGTESETGTQTTPQGNLAGHGITADANYICNYRVQEFGYIVGVLMVQPVANYTQGINKQWLRKTRFDFYMPEFSHLSSAAVEQAEIFTTDDEDENSIIFGYQGIFNEMRSKQSMVCGNLRGDLSYWNLARHFEEAPLLNGSFIECNPRKDVFAVPSEPGLIITFGNDLKVVRPMPVISEPGLLDHN